VVLIRGCEDWLRLKRRLAEAEEQYRLASLRESPPAVESATTAAAYDQPDEDDEEVRVHGHAHACMACIVCMMHTHMAVCTSGGEARQKGNQGAANWDDETQ